MRLHCMHAMWRVATTCKQASLHLAEGAHTLIASTMKLCTQSAPLHTDGLSGGGGSSVSETFVEDPRLSRLVGIVTDIVFW
jgi:hypothetical protein